MRFLIKLAVIVLILAYVAVCTRYYLVQDKYIYLPDNSEFSNCSTSAQKISFNGTRLYFAERSSKAVIVYHGRSDTACSNLGFDYYAKNKNYSFIAVEYFGYAPAGKPSQKMFEQDVRNTVYFIKNNNLSSDIVIGESLGTAMASYHASTTNASKLILFSPFDELGSIGEVHYPYLPVKLFLRDKFNEKEYLKGWRRNTTVIVGGNDTLIPPTISYRLFEGLKGDKNFIIVANATHETLRYNLSNI